MGLISHKLFRNKLLLWGLMWNWLWLLWSGFFLCLQPICMYLFYLRFSLKFKYLTYQFLGLLLILLIPLCQNNNFWILNFFIYWLDIILFWSNKIYFSWCWIIISFPQIRTWLFFMTSITKILLMNSFGLSLIWRMACW